MSEAVVAFLQYGAVGLVALVAITGCVWLVRLYRDSQEARVGDAKEIAKAVIGLAGDWQKVAVQQATATEAHNSLLTSMRDECRSATKDIAEDVRTLLLDEHRKGETR